MIFNLLNRLKNELYIDLNGSKEILLEIAEKTSAKVESIKKAIEAAELDSKIDREYEGLGTKIYSLIKEGKDTVDDPEIINRINRLRHLKRMLLRLEEEMVYISEKVLTGKLLDLKDELKKGSATLETITITNSSSFVKKKISDLRLPPGMLIILIKRSDQLLIPDGMMELNVGDSITMIGYRSGIDDAIRLFNGKQNQVV